MPQICLIYARANKPVVRWLHALLSAKYDVWWDEDIPAGDYRLEIERQLRRATCVIPVWCAVSRADSDVIDEAETAKRAGIPLLPVRTELVQPPLGFGALQTTDLLAWKGEPSHPGVQQLLVALEGLLAQHTPKRLQLPGKSVDLPLFVPSVSSHETQLRPVDALRALTLFQPEALLVSAYDIHHEASSDEIIELLGSYRARGGMVILDSGNYESMRKGDVTWNPEKLRLSLERTPHDAAFCYDTLTPPADVEEAVQDILAAVQRDSVTSSSSLPIVHAVRGTDGRYLHQRTVDVIVGVSQRLHPPLIAVPERELGDGVSERARNVYRIRAALDELGFFQPLHVLGTGNPLTLAILAAAGADSFDGLEWCRTVVDHGDGRLYHFQHYDFFAYQTGLAETEIVRTAANSPEIGYAGKVAFHNLEFWREWTTAVREMVATAGYGRFLGRRLPGGRAAVEDLARVLPEVFG